jgi:hexosaminidase
VAGALPLLGRVFLFYCFVLLSQFLSYMACRDAKVNASTVYGAYHALQTLSQLITFDFDTKRYSISAVPWLITDAPRFSHREVLVDTSRHWQPLPKLVSCHLPTSAFLLLIKLTSPSLLPARDHRQSYSSKTQRYALAYSGFPVVSVRVEDFPGTCKRWFVQFNRAIQVNHMHPLLFSSDYLLIISALSTEDVEDIVEYARARGVRIMPEVDTPGHAASFCAGHPEVCPSALCLEPLNPATEATFDLLRGLFSDITGGARGVGLFPDNMMHLGGDEVDPLPQ